MARKITITLDDELGNMLRDRQSQMIKKNSSGVSFSQVINDVLRESFSLE